MVAGVPEDRIVSDTEGSQLSPQPPDLLVKQRNFPVISGVFLFGIQGRARWNFLVWVMGRGKPDYREERVRLLGLPADKLDRVGHQHLGTTASSSLHLPVSTQPRVVVKEIESDYPLVEAHAGWIAWRVGLARSKVDFSENASGITSVSQRFANRLFLRTQVSSVVGDLGSDGRSSGHHTGTRWRAYRCCGVKPVEDEAFS